MEGGRAALSHGSRRAELPVVLPTNLPAAAALRFSSPRSCCFSEVHREAAMPSCLGHLALELPGSTPGPAAIRGLVLMADCIGWAGIRHRFP